MATIVPAILAKDVSTFEEELTRVQEFVPRVQMDVVDGKFAPVETVTPDVLPDLETELEVEAHLMVEEPEEWVERCVAAGVTGVYGQVEKMSDKLNFINTAAEAGLRVGLAFDIGTPLAGLEDWINLIDAVLLMGVPAGAQGQAFDEKVLEKIKQVREMSTNVTIVMDGGLNEENVKRCLSIGKEKMEFAVGSEILNSDNAEFTYRKLTEIS